MILSQHSIWLQTWRPGPDPWQGLRIYLAASSVQTGFGAQLPSGLMGNGGRFDGGKARLGHEADHSATYTVEIKNE
jgi:hypothetical protein